MKIQVLIIYGPHSVLIVYGDAVILMQERKPGTKCGGTSCAGGLGDRSPPVGSRGEVPVGGLGDEVPQKLKQFWISICIILN